MNLMRKATVAATVAGLAATGLLAGGAPAGAAPSALHITGTVSLGAVTSKFRYQFSEAPNGTVYYFRGRAVYAVAGTQAPVAVLHAGSNVLAVAANQTYFFVRTGRTVRAYSVAGRRFARKWTLPKSPGQVVSAGLIAVGRTLWAWTDWLSHPYSTELAAVSRISTSSATVHKVSSNIAYADELAANSAGLYYQASIGAKNYLIRVTPSGRATRRPTKRGGVPLTLAVGRVFMVDQHYPGGQMFLDGYSGSTLRAVLSRQVFIGAFSVAGTGAGLLMVQLGKITRLSTRTGKAIGTLRLANAGMLVGGPSAVAIAGTSADALLVRLAD